VRRWIGVQSVFDSASQGKAIFAATFCGVSWYFKVYFARVGLLRPRAISLAVSNVLQRLSFRESKQKWHYDLKTCMEGSSRRIIFVWTIPGGVKLTVRFELIPCDRFCLATSLYLVCRSSSDHYTRK